MVKSVVRGIALCIAAGLSVAACGSSGSGGSSGPSSSGSGSAAGGGGSRTITVGVITSLTGAASSGFLTAEKGVKARLGAQNAAGGVDGTKVNYVVADDASSATGALAAAKNLIQNKHVSAILPVSAFFYGAAPYVKSQGIPVTGSSFDGPEWTVAANTNLFPGGGSVDYSKAATTYATFLKSQGVTKLATIGNTGSPTSAGAAKQVVKAARSVGLQIGYENENVPFGTTDVGAMAIAIKSSGADGLYLPVIPNTAFALAGALQQMGVKPKAVILATGYGGDLLQSPQAVAAAQGYDFATTITPVELNTPVTKKLVSDMSTYASVTGVPTFAEYSGYVDADLYLYGLKLNGGDPSASSYISKLRKDSGWNAGGLYNKAVDFSKVSDIGSALGPGNCLYVVKLVKTTFVPISGAVPVCGNLLT